MKIKHLIPAVGLVLGAFGFQASAAEIYPNFCVDPTAGGAIAAPSGLGSNTPCNAASGPATGFSADYLTGGYSEGISIRPTGPGTFSFNSMIVARWTGFSFDDNPGANVAKTGLGQTYFLYAVVEALGTASGNVFTPTSATFKLYLDYDGDTQSNTIGYTNGGAALSTYSFDTGNDSLLGSGVYAFGSGSLEENNQNFGITFKNFALTTAADGVVNGENFFIAPRPFHVNVFSDGEISNGTLTAVTAGDFTAGGDLSANFVIPEPGSLALVGLSLSILGLSLRRRNRS